MTSWEYCNNSVLSRRWDKVDKRLRDKVSERIERSILLPAECLLHKSSEIDRRVDLGGPMTDTILITGGNRGIGLATARKLAEQGFHVTITARNLQQGQEAANTIRRQVINANVAVMQLDLASIDPIRQKFTESFNAQDYRLRVLINNAGVMCFDKHIQFTADGFELQFGTNHLGHFLLTNLLLDNLQRSAPARVVTVSSGLHIPGVGVGPPPSFDFDNLRGERYYEPMVFYKNSKLANVWFAYELQRRLKGTGVTSNAVDPGFVPTTIAEHQRGIHRLLFKYVMPLLPTGRSLEQAATNSAFAAIDLSLEGVGGKYIADCKEKRSSEESYDEIKAARLWKLSEELTGLAENQ